MRNLLRPSSLMVAAFLLAITLLSSDVFSAEPAGASVPRITRSNAPSSLAVRKVKSAARSLPLCTSSRPRLQRSHIKCARPSGAQRWSIFNSYFPI